MILQILAPSQWFFKLSFLPFPKSVLAYLQVSGGWYQLAGIDATLTMF
jgi:hypothetical protein